MTEFRRRKKQIGVGGAVITPLHKRYVMRVLASGRLSYGPFLKAFEAKFAKLHNRRFAVSANSGTSALQVALHALKELDGWRDGDEVLVPAMTFIATSNVVIQNGLKPVFVDIDPRTYHIDPKGIERRITKRTRAIMPVHLFGVSCDMKSIKAIAKKHKLRIVEDACQTAAVTHRGKPVGSQGDIACFSTYIAHIITTGVGGMALTNDKQIALKMRSLVNHGRDNIYIAADDDKGLSGKRLVEVMSRRFNFVSVGYSYRLTELEGALGLAEIKNISKNIAIRQRNAEKLLTLLEPYEKYLQLPWWPEHSEHAFMMFPVVVKTKKFTPLEVLRRKIPSGNFSALQKGSHPINEQSAETVSLSTKHGLLTGFTRDELTRWLEEHNVETRPFYSLLGQPVYRRFFGEDAAKRYPVAYWAQRNGFFIGCHVELGSKDIQHIGDVFKEFFRKKKLP